MMFDLAVDTLLIALATLTLGILLGPISGKGGILLGPNAGGMAPKSRFARPAIVAPVRFQPTLPSAPWPRTFVVDPVVAPSWHAGLNYTCIYCSPAGLSESGRDRVFQL